jgi:predicted transcriptional regulator
VSIKLNIYEEIRYYSSQGEYGKKEVARMLNISINTVRKYWDGKTVPWERKEGTGKTAPVITDEIREFVVKCLKDDENAPRKQRHTARRIYERLINELDFEGGESTIRNLVADLKKSNPKAK